MVFGLVTFFASCGDDENDGKGDNDIVEDTTANVEDTAKVETIDYTAEAEYYATTGACLACHGEKGHGKFDNPDNNPALIGNDLTGDSAKFDAERWKAAIENGVEGTKMVKPAVAPADVDKLIKYIREELSK